MATLSAPRVPEQTWARLSALYSMRDPTGVQRYLEGRPELVAILELSCKCNNLT